MNRIKIELISDMLFDVDGHSVGCTYLALMEHKEMNVGEAKRLFLKSLGITKEKTEEYKVFVDFISESIDNENYSTEDFKASIENLLIKEVAYLRDITCRFELGLNDKWFEKVEGFAYSVSRNSKEDDILDLRLHLDKALFSINNCITFITEEFKDFLETIDWVNILDVPSENTIEVNNRNPYYDNHILDVLVHSKNLETSNEKIGYFGGIYDY